MKYYHKAYAVEKKAKKKEKAFVQVYLMKSKLSLYEYIVAVAVIVQALS